MTVERFEDIPYKNRGEIEELKKRVAGLEGQLRDLRSYVAEVARGNTPCK